jgi:aspartyl-tRNA(Asn)/glutamyl-tRNA(Gln) amidotransferase subunit B
MNLEPVIGIEIHCELKTQSKMFSAAPVGVFQAPNTAVNEIDLGHPGVLPSVNQAAVELGLRACFGLNLKVNPTLRFDRKNYFYSDLPKGFQITQQFHPLGQDGYIDLETDTGVKRIGIERLHLEEDTAKQFHLENETWIDFNRAGTPLIEIVSKPELTNAHEATVYVDTLRSILIYLGVSDGKMEEGSLRCDVNISLKEVGSSTFGVKTEIKNLNSISNIERAIRAEIERQSALIEKGEAVEQATRRYDDQAKTTVLMRKKEGSVDYKYFPEPNLPPIALDPTWLASIQAALPELPAARKARYRELGLSDYDATTLTANKALADFFERVLAHSAHAKAVANWCLGEVLAKLSPHELSDRSHALQEAQLAAMIDEQVHERISSKQAKQIFDALVQGSTYAQAVEQLGVAQVSDESALRALVETVLNDNETSIQDYHAGRDRALGYLMGQIMKLSKGQANPKVTNRLLLEALEKRKPQ